MDTTQHPGSAPPPEAGTGVITADLLDRLTSADPADAPAVAEELAVHLTEALDATGGGDGPQQLRAPFSDPGSDR